MQDSAFGGQQLVTNEKPETSALFKKEKAKTNKIMMNEQNWQLAQNRPDLYIPNKLPFFKPGYDQVKEEVDDGNKIIKLQKTQSHYSVGVHESVDKADCEVKDLFMGHEQNTEITFSEHEALLLQLPGTLPFGDVKPHTGNALEEIIEKLSRQGNEYSQFKHGNAESDE